MPGAHATKIACITAIANVIQRDSTLTASIVQKHAEKKEQKKNQSKNVNNQSRILHTSKSFIHHFLKKNRMT